MQRVTIGDFMFRQRYVCSFIEPLKLLWYQTVSLLTPMVAYPCCGKFTTIYGVATLLSKFKKRREVMNCAYHVHTLLFHTGG